MASVTRPRAESALSLKFVIIGSSIAGLATAYALARVGHRVTVIERTDGSFRSHGIIYSPPNMTRILNSWGIREEFERIGMRVTALGIYQGSSGELLGKLEMDERLRSELNSEFYLLRHGDLHTILYDLAIQTGVKFRFNTRAIKVDSKISGVFLEQGETILADVIVGADGRESLVRPAVQNISKTVGKPKDTVVLTATIPTAVMESDPELSPLLGNDNWRCWADSGFYAMGCSTYDLKDYNFTASVTHRLAQSFGENYNQTCSKTDFKAAFTPLDPRLWKLMELAKCITPTACVIRDPFENAVCERAVICLVGEAGHPMLPNGIQNAAMSLEDASTLGCLFAGANHPDQISRLLTGYEELRQPRWAVAQTLDIKRRHVLSLPPGIEQEERDKSFRASGITFSTSTAEKASVGPLGEFWREIVDQYAFDSIEAANDWKGKWVRALNQRTVGALDWVDTTDNTCI